jgi:hypothetical protein
VLDGPPRVSDVDRLVRLGIPRPLLLDQGTVNETFALLEALRRRGLASVGAARLLRARGVERPRSVSFVDIPAVLRRLKECSPVRDPIQRGSDAIQQS